MSETWEIVREQFGASLQRSEPGAEATPPSWRVITPDGRLAPVADEAAGIATLAFEARRARAGQPTH